MMWGFVRWGKLAEEMHNYENGCVDFLLLSDGRQVYWMSLIIQQSIVS